MTPTLARKRRPVACALLGLMLTGVCDVDAAPLPTTSDGQRQAVVGAVGAGRDSEGNVPTAPVNAPTAPGTTVSGNMPSAPVNAVSVLNGSSGPNVGSAPNVGNMGNAPTAPDGPVVGMVPAVPEAGADGEVLLREAESILGVTLPPFRRDALRRYLAGAASGLLITQAGKGSLESGAGAAGRGPQVQRDALRSLLAELGALYTRGAMQPYRLELRLADPGRENEARSDVARLEPVGGLVQQAGVPLCLTLSHAQGLWQGQLHDGTHHLQVAFPSVEGVWRGLWGRYFRERTETGPLTAYTLEVWGWRDGTQVERLDKALRGWNGTVAHPALQGLRFNPEGASALWRLDVRHAEELRDRLAGFGHELGLRFRLDMLAAAPPVSNPAAPTGPAAPAVP